MRLAATFAVPIPDRAIAAKIAALLAGLFAVLLTLAACSIQLSPQFNKAIYDRVIDLNVQTETLFAGLAMGGTAADFRTEAVRYDDIIGGFSALRMQIAPRSVPNTNLRSLGLGSLTALCAGTPAVCVDATGHHLDKIIALLTSQRDAHQRGKLTAGLVVGFKGQYEIEMSPVLTYETALQR